MNLSQFLRFIITLLEKHQYAINIEYKEGYLITAREDPKINYARKKLQRSVHNSKKKSFSNVRQQWKVHPGIDIDSATHVIEAGE